MWEIEKKKKKKKKKKLPFVLLDDLNPVNGTASTGNDIDFILRYIQIHHTLTLKIFFLISLGQVLTYL